MIIGYLETGEVRVYSNLSEAMEEWANFPTDILSDVILFYDLEGQFYQPSPKYAKRRWYQLSSKIESFAFSPCDPKDIHEDTLGYLLHYEATKLQENPHIKSLDALRKLVPCDQ